MRAEVGVLDRLVPKASCLRQERMCDSPPGGLASSSSYASGSPAVSAHLRRSSVVGVCLPFSSLPTFDLFQPYRSASC